MSRATDLAEWLEGAKLCDDAIEWAEKLYESAAELRRLDRVNAELVEALRNITDQLERVGDTRPHKDGEYIEAARAALTSSSGEPNEHQ